MSHDENEPRLDRLLDAIPTMMAEVDRRRREAVTPAARVRAAGGVWLPRLAAATALLVLAALAWPLRSGTGSPAEGNDAAALERWIVVGGAETALEDPVLDALVRR
jgi:hypothetical protein